MFNIVLIVCGLLLALYYLATRKFNYWKKSNVPHLPPAPLFGNYGCFIFQRKTMGEVVQEICQKFPGAPFVGAYYGTEPVLIPRDPEVIKRILAKDFYYFNGREISDHAHKDTDLFQLFASYGDHWKVLRQNLTPLFSSAKMKLMFELIAQCAHSMEKLLEKESKAKDLDAKVLMDRFTIQCIGACVFGVETDTIENAEGNVFTQAGSNIVHLSKFVSFKNIVRTIWPSIFYGLGLTVFAGELNPIKEILKTVFKQRNYKPTTRNDFVDLILLWKQKNQIEGNKLHPSGSLERGKATINITDDLLIAQCIVFYAAGYETSSTTLAFTLFELAKNEKVQQKLCEEIDAVLARHNNKIKYDCLSELQYLDACLNETLRMYPVMGAINREVMENYSLTPNIKLDKGVRVHIPVLYLHRNPEYFSQPEEYRPERFYGEEKNNLVPYTYLPFGEGPRICIVREFTEVRVELQMERWAARGGSVRLRCVHDVPPHMLDKVVFLRQGTKIFQYIRDRKPPYRNFTTPGAVLNIALATENSITLQNLEFDASGNYSCEVSLDTPIYTKASSEKHLTVFQPQKHHPRIDIPTNYLSSGETLRANCITAPALPAPHITWFVNGKKMDELVAHSHKFRVPMNERNGRKGIHRNFEYDGQSTPPSLVALTHASHVATKPPGCSLKDNQLDDLQLREKPNAIQSTNRHKSRKPSRKDLFVTISELQLVATEGLNITCVSTIPEFRSIEDRFADIRNFTIIVDVISPSTYMQLPTNITTADFNTSGVSRTFHSSLSYVLVICLLIFA